MTAIPDVLRQIFEIDPSAGMIEVDGHWLNWGDAARISDTLGAMFDEAGLPEGGRVGVLLRNQAGSALAAIGCVVTRRTIVAFNPLLPADQLADDLAEQAPAMLLGTQDDLASEGAREAIDIMGLPVIALQNRSGGMPEWIHRSKVTDEVANTSHLAPETLIELLTSGTSGKPKRISLSHKGFELSLSGANALEAGRKRNAQPVLRRGVRVISAPISHISGMSVLIFSLAGARPIALLPRFQVDIWVDAIERHQAKVVNLPPAALRMILDAEIPKERIDSLIAIRVGAAPLDENTEDRFMERYAIPLLQQYGATEFSGGIAGWTLQDHRNFFASKRGSVGRLQSNIEGRIVDVDTGEDLGTGTQGLLELRGQQLGDPDKWVRTTDIATLDDDRFLWIHGRADSAINRGGFKIHPDDIAQQLESHPSISEAVVVGLSDERLGETPGAVVVLVAGHDYVTAEGILDFAKENLLPYQVPVRLRIVGEIPRNHSLKPIIPEVRKLLADPNADNA